LISEQEFSDRECIACAHEWKLWDRILKLTADSDGRRDPVYGDLARRGFAIEQRVTDFRQPISELSGPDWDLLQIVHGARMDYESHRAWKANEEAKKDRG